MAFSSGKKVHLLVSILAAITLIIFSHSGILHLKLKMKSVHCIPKTELNEQATPFQNEVEGFVKVQARREGGYDWCARTLHRPQRSTFFYDK